MSKRYDLLNLAVNKEEVEIYTTFCLENMLLNLGNAKNNNSVYTSIQLESLLVPMSLKRLEETREIFNYDIYNIGYEDQNNSYCREAQKTFKKLLVNNINK